MPKPAPAAAKRAKERLEARARLHQELDELSDDDEDSSIPCKLAWKAMCITL
jgi:hypothetical protein